MSPFFRRSATYIFARYHIFRSQCAHSPFENGRYPAVDFETNFNQLRHHHQVKQALDNRSNKVDPLKYIPVSAVGSCSMFSSNSSTNDVHTALERLQRLEDSLRYRGYSTIRIALGVAATIGFVVYLFRESLRDNVAEEVSQVASRSLEDEMVIGKVEEFAKSLLHAIGNDDNMKIMTADFMKEVIQREETREAVKTLVLNVLNDPTTREQLGQEFKELIVKAVSDKSTQAALKDALRNILQDEGTKEVVKDLLRSVFSQEDVIMFTSSFFKEVIKSELVVQQATTLGKQVTQDVIADPKIQEATSNTIWQAVKMTVTPRWFSSSEISDDLKDDED